ncbi:hypothetical protein CA13_45430 [Planctomycetes bacterium CA13]|uniref:DUF2809 domain-containing protein n=1 Tax=Novipirellula herctigrandis TaxID=2527986 RepID=A0A5C5Z7A8_9BACT|nr:hypothetical protein CA13_45430 [Planctomycetes bacterium CA13]
MNRAVAALLCITLTALCFGYAWLRSDLPVWWRLNGGGVVYVVFWITFGFVFFPYRRRVVAICVTATALTCLLEILQLWKPAWLLKFRATKFGAALLGSEFAWQDIPPYLIGGIAGYGLLLAACSLSRSKTPDV